MRKRRQASSNVVAVVVVVVVRRRGPKLLLPFLLQSRNLCPPVRVSQPLSVQSRAYVLSSDEIAIGDVLMQWKYY